MKEIFGIEELDSFILENANKNMVICLYFGANWCGPCKQLKNILCDPETLINMSKLVVGYLDVDEESNNDLLAIYNINALPTQVFIKLDKNKVITTNRIEGYDFTKLKFEYDSYLSKYLDS
jgi:thiol-disulfide isomerase/thioredoxin